MDFWPWHVANSRAGIWQRIPVRAARIRGMLCRTSSGLAIIIRSPAHSLDFGVKASWGRARSERAGDPERGGARGQGWTSLLAAANLSQGRAFLCSSLTWPGSLDRLSGAVHTGRVLCPKNALHKHVCLVLFPPSAFKHIIFETGCWCPAFYPSSHPTFTVSPLCTRDLCEVLEREGSIKHGFSLKKWWFIEKTVMEATHHAVWKSKGLGLFTYLSFPSWICYPDEAT